MKLKNGMIIKCNSKEEAQEFIKEAYEQGFKWFSNYHEGDEEKTCWDCVCDFNSEIYYYLETDEITWSSMYSGNNSIEYSTLKEKMKTMTKSDLKNGMIVQTRNDDKWLVNNGCLLSEEYGCIMIGVYNDELEHPVSYCFDIVNVYTSKAMSITDLFNEKYLNLIWKRRENFEIGDIVRVVEKEKSYDTYIDFFIEQDLPIDYAARYVYHHLPDEESKYRILHIGKHDYKDNDVIVVESVKTDEIYLVDSDSVEIYKKNN